MAPSLISPTDSVLFANIRLTPILKRDGSEIGRGLCLENVSGRLVRFHKEGTYVPLDWIRLPPSFKERIGRCRGSREVRAVLRFCPISKVVDAT